MAAPRVKSAPKHLIALFDTHRALLRHPLGRVLRAAQAPPRLEQFLGSAPGRRIGLHRLVRRMKQLVKRRLDSLLPDALDLLRSAAEAGAMEQMRGRPVTPFLG